jgi:hypothetical protein
MLRRATVVTITWLAACGGGSSTAPERLFDRAACENVVACGFSPTVDECMTDSADRTSQELTLAADLAAGTIVYHADKAAACVAFFRDKACDGGIDIGEWLDRLPCRDAYEGTVAPGGACTMAYECAGGLTCAFDPSCTTACCQGTCAAPPSRALVGQSCASLACVEGAWCDATMICRAQVTQTGQPCTSPEECARPLLCKQDPTTSAYTTCEARSEAGGRCDAGFQCAGPHLFCDATSSTCVAKGKPGDACDADHPCLYDATCAAGTCVLLQGQGGACVSQGDCLTPLTCGASETCELFPDGMACP